MRLNKMNKACPFCKSTSLEISTYGVDPEWKMVHCNDCGADGPPDLGNSGAIEKWDDRLIEYDLEQKIESFEEIFTAWRTHKTLLLDCAYIDRVIDGFLS